MDTPAVSDKQFEEQITKLMNEYVPKNLFTTGYPVDQNRITLKKAMDKDAG
jgi:hypothetical protein